MCFWNAYVLTFTRPRLIYVEGFARIPVGRKADRIVHHAWASDEKGCVYDPTQDGTEYFGIPFRFGYVKRTMKRILPRCFSLLDNSVEGYPLLESKSTRAWLLPMGRSPAS